MVANLPAGVVYARPSRSLADIAAQAGLGGLAEAELAVLRMMDAGEVSARIRCRAAVPALAG